MDPLEMIEIEHQQPNAAAVLFGFSQAGLQLVGKAFSIRQRRERIIVGQGA